MLYSNCTIYSNTFCFRRNHILYGMIVSNIQLLMGVYDSGKKFANFKRNIAVFSEKKQMSPTSQTMVYGGNFSHEAVTLKIRSRSPKSNKLYRLANLVTFIQWSMRLHANTFWLKFGRLSPAVSLKIRSRSPKPIQLFIMSKCYGHANLVKICQLVHEILGTQAPLWLQFGSLSHSDLEK